MDNLFLTLCLNTWGRLKIALSWRDIYTLVLLEDCSTELTNLAYLRRIFVLLNRNG